MSYALANCLNTFVIHEICWLTLNFDTTKMPRYCIIKLRETENYSGQKLVLTIHVQMLFSRFAA